METNETFSTSKKYTNTIQCHYIIICSKCIQATTKSIDQSKNTLKLSKILGKFFRNFTASYTIFNKIFTTIDAIFSSYD